MNEIGPTMQSSKKTWTQSQLEQGESEDWNLRLLFAFTSVLIGKIRKRTRVRSSEFVKTRDGVNIKLKQIEAVVSVIMAQRETHDIYVMNLYQL